MKPVTIVELIAFLQTKPLQPPRADGWVHDNWNERELRTQAYLVFLGN